VSIATGKNSSVDNFNRLKLVNFGRTYILISNFWELNIH